MKHLKAWTRFGALLLTVLTLALVAISCNTKIVPPATIEMEKKYISADTVGLLEKEEFFRFHKNETGEYHYRTVSKQYIENELKDVVSAYTVSFRYTVDPETQQIFCFFDSIEYDEEHTAGRSGDAQRTWYAVLNYSEHVLIWEQLSEHSTTDLYVCEDYLSEIPNFRNIPKE